MKHLIKYLTLARDADYRMYYIGMYVIVELVLP